MVMTGTAGAQAIGLLILPLLARSFAPEAFGVFQLYLSVLIFCTVGIALRIEVTIVSVDEDEVQQTVALLFGLVLAVGVALLVILLVYEVFAQDVDFPAWLIGLGLIGNGFIQITCYKLIRDQDFLRLSGLKFFQVFVYAVVAVAIAALNPTLVGIIVADVVGRLAAALFAVHHMQRSNVTGKPVIQTARILSFVRRNWQITAISLPGALANSGGAMLTPIMIFQVFGASAAGQYALVDRAMGVPVAMIVSAGSQVFLGRVAEQLRAGNPRIVFQLFLRLVFICSITLIIGAVAVRLLIPSVFGFIFGAGWEPAAKIAGILIFSYAFAVVAGIVNQTLIALRAFRLQASWDLAWPISMSAAWFAIVTWQLDLYAAVGIHAAVVSGLGLAFILLCILELRRSTAAASTVGA